MRFASHVALSLLCACALIGSATAQCTTGGGAVDLTLNGTIGIGQTIAIEMPSTLDISLIDNVAPGNAFILVAGNGILCGAIPLVWGGSIDVAAPAIVANGVTPSTIIDFMCTTDFTVSVPTSCTMAGLTGPSFQAIHVDPAAAPYFFNHTGAAEILYSNAATMTTVYDAMADDSSTQHILGMDPCSGYNGMSITLGGNVYSSLFIGSNGQVTFGGGSTDFTPTLAEFFNGWASGLVGVATLWTDLARTGVPDSVVVTEDLGLGTVKVEYKNQQWWGSSTPAGNWNCTFGALGIDTFTIDLTAVLPGVNVTDGNPIVGVTDGVVSGTGDTSLDYDVALAAGGGTYITPAGNAPESICEQYLQAGGSPTAPLDNIVLSFLDVSSTFDWLIL